MFFMLIFFIFNPHPLFSSLLLLLFSFSMMIIINNFSNWMNFIISLIYLGGVLILFIYVSSVAPNKKNKFYWHMSSLLVLFLFFFSEKNFIHLNFSKMIFYSPIFFKFWVLFLILMLLILFLISDFCKVFFSSFRSM